MLRRWLLKAVRYGFEQAWNCKPIAILIIWFRNLKRSRPPPRTVLTRFSWSKARTITIAHVENRRISPSATAPTRAQHLSLYRSNGRSRQGMHTSAGAKDPRISLCAMALTTTRLTGEWILITSQFSQNVDIYWTIT